METTAHWLPKTSAISVINSGFLIAWVFNETLSAPALISLLTSSTELIPPPTVNGIKHDLDKTSKSSKFNILFAEEALISNKIISSTSHLTTNSKGNLGRPIGRYFLKPILCTIKLSLISKQAISLFFNIRRSSFFLLRNL